MEEKPATPSTDTEEHPETLALRQELEEFRKEKQAIRDFVGQIGGADSGKRDNIINVVFVVTLVLLFSLDILRHFLKINVPFPPIFSVELAVLLVSIKIIWMIHKQTKVEHFQFWILNSIEFRLNDIAKRTRKIEEKLDD